MRIASVMDLPEQHRAEAQRQINGQPPRAAVLIHQGNTSTPQGVVDPHAKKPSKYRNIRVVLEGEVYDSRKEYEFHQQQKLRLKAGEIVLCLRQVPFRLEGGVVYRADFVNVLAAAPFVEVWDVKGFDTRSSINKRKQVRARYGIEVMLWPPREGRVTP